MYMILDSDFCFNEAPWLSWRDIQYGFENGFLSSAGVIEYAIKRLSVESSSEHYELASLADNNINDIRDYLECIVARDMHCIDSPERVWLFLTFLWFFKNRNKYKDPLGIVEELYAEFNYPECVASIVRYMPAKDPSLVGEEHIFKKWSDMLDTLRAEFQESRKYRLL